MVFIINQYYKNETNINYYIDTPTYLPNQVGPDNIMYFLIIINHTHNKHKN